MNVSDSVEKCFKKIPQWLCTWLTRNIIIIIMYLCICRKYFSIERVLVKCDVTVSRDCFHSHSRDKRHKYLTWRPKCDFLFYFTPGVTVMTFWITFLVGFFGCCVECLYLVNHDFDYNIILSYIYLWIIE